MSQLRTCELCNVRHLAVTFESCELFPVSECCGDCAADLLEDDAYPRDTPCCTSGCHVCTGERSYSGF